MGPLHFIALLGCAEWLLIFRTWVSLRYLLLYAGFAALRLLYLMDLFPHWENNYVLVGASFVAVIWHLRALWRANTSHNQQTYDTPETGVPWLVIVARDPKRAFALECAIIALFIFFMANYSAIVYTRGFTALPLPVQTFLASESAARAFVWLHALWMIFSYSLWNLAVSGKPLLPERKKPAAGAQRYVRRQDHALPELPGVKELSEDLGDW